MYLHQAITNKKAQTFPPFPDGRLPFKRGTYTIRTATLYLLLLVGTNFFEKVLLLFIVRWSPPICMLHERLFPYKCNFVLFIYIVSCDMAS